MFGVEVQIVQAHVRLVLPLFEEVNGLVDGDPVNPGEKAGVTFERFERLISLDECLLREVVGVFVIGGHMVNGGVDALLITAHQPVICLQVPAFGALDQPLLHLRITVRRRGDRSEGSFLEHVGVHGTVIKPPARSFVAPKIPSAQSMPADFPFQAGTPDIAAPFRETDESRRTSRREPRTCPASRPRAPNFRLPTARSAFATPPGPRRPIAPAPGAPATSTFRWPGPCPVTCRPRSPPRTGQGNRHKSGKPSPAPDRNGVTPHAPSERRRTARPPSRTTARTVQRSSSQGP